MAFGLILGGVTGASSAADAAPGRVAAPRAPEGSQPEAIPAAGSSTSSPETAITITGVPAASVGAITVDGSVSGSHTGTVRALPNDQGAVLQPAQPFVAGETVDVTSSVTVSGAEGTTYSFTVGTPADHPGVQLAGDEGGSTGGSPSTRAATPAPKFVTRPDLRPPGVTINQAANGTAPGLLFATPSANPTSGVDQGVMIYDDSGQPVWFRPTPGVDLAGDAKVVTYAGEPALTWFEGDAPCGAGNYRGEWVVVDDSYREVKRVRMGNGYQADVHDITFTDRGTAYLMAYNPLVCTGTAPLDNCKPGATVLEALTQEVDLGTGLVLWEWHSLDHVDLEDSYLDNNAPLVDYLHINSLALDDDGDVLISGRHTSALYKIDRQTGELIWTFGGKQTSFPTVINEPNAITGPDFPHHFRSLGGGSYSYFDNGSRRMGPSRGAIVTLSPGTGSATYTTKLIRNPPLFGPTQGAMQNLPGGHNLVTWGGLGVLTEYDQTNTPVFDASLTSSGSYRQFRHEWTGAPAEAPVAKAGPAAGGTAVSVSWNGDTRTTRWRILAGSTPVDLSPVATVSRSGFETSTVVPTGSAWIAVEALDGADAVLGRSAPVQGSQWFTESAAPAAGNTYTPLVGDFGGSRNDDVLYYRPGAGADYLHVSDGQGGFTSIGLTPIGGNYSPLVGDFVGDDRDDVLFTAPGSPTAYLWRFDLKTRTGAVTAASAPVRVPSTVTKALVLDNRPSYGGGYDEILWYAAGPAPDRVDRFAWPAGAGLKTVSRAEAISGNYLPATGDFDGNGQADVLFYGPGAQRDSIWFTQGTATGSTGHRSSVFDVNGTYVPFTGNFTGTEQRDELLYYASGGAFDHLWTFDASGAYVSKSVPTAASGFAFVLQGSNDRLMTWTPGTSLAILLFTPGAATNRPSGNTALPAGYRPLVGDFVGAGGTSSVLWYAPGGAPERLYRGA